MRANTYSYLIDDGSEDKKAKGRKECVIKRKLEFENYKNCLKAYQLENKINLTLLIKNKIDIDNFFRSKRRHQEIIKNNKLILKIQQRFRSEKNNDFTKEINKIVLSQMIITEQNQLIRYKHMHREQVKI